MSVDNTATGTFTGDTISTPMTFPAMDLTGATTGTLDFTTTSTWIPEDKEAFLTEWKKLRKEFLPLLLKDDYYAIKNMKQVRVMDSKTKITSVILTIEYTPKKDDPEKKVRTTL